MDKSEFLDRVMQRNPKMNIDRLENALNFADIAHQGQTRNSGELYISHPMEVALILAELDLDEDTIIAGLLHDVIEDTKSSYEDIKERFGQQVADIVEGVTKIERIRYESLEIQQAENFRKMLLAMSKDIRVILVKLADRLHNMRTLDYKRGDKRVQTSNETLEIYVPIAHRLGIFKIKWELEDLAFKYKSPKEYRNIVTLVNQKRKQREADIAQRIEEISELLSQNSIEHKIYGRPKNYFSIYKKMSSKNRTFEEIHDITAIRVIVKEVSECYGVLGIIHSKWKPIPGRFKDYIAMPKPNMYQSLHTTLISEGARTFEVQIRTEEMHRIAEYGIAAHWKYKKEGRSSSNLSWLDQLMEWEHEVKNPTEFINSVKMDLFINHVYVFTPQGLVLELPEGSTPVDFAYKIHTDVGDSCIGAKVNGRIVALNYELKIGDIVEILTSKTSNGPSRDWLKFVKSSHARNKIRNFFRRESRQENIIKGRDLLEKSLQKYNLTLKEVVDNKKLEEKLLSRSRMTSFEQIFSSLGYGGLTVKQLIPVIKEELVQEEEVLPVLDKRNVRRAQHGVIVDGYDDMLVRFAKCCNPIPGDEIIGFITRGSGVTVHRSDCSNFNKDDLDSKRFIEVTWQEGDENVHQATLKIIGRDRSGILSDVTSLIQNSDHAIRGINVKVNNAGLSTMVFTFDVHNKTELNAVNNRIRSISGVLEVFRL